MVSVASATAGPAPARDSARAPVRVMAVDDSVVIRGLIGRWVGEEPGLELVAKCANGQIAVDTMATARPDIVILDIEMPVMDGLTALPLILANEPRPHVIVASTLTKRNAAVTLQALARGASECLPKPESNSAISTSADFRRELIAKIRALGGLDREGWPTEGGSAGAPRAGSRGTGFTTVPFQTGVVKLLAIGSSTGGPKALATVLDDVRDAIAGVPVLITQHMPPTFTAMLAENLERACGRPAKEAEDGEVPQRGTVYVAPGGRHLTVKRAAGGAVMALDDRPPVNFTKPSVDVMFESIAGVYGGAVLGVVLTGMGHDGAAGAGALRAAGGNILAQDEATSVVWGMPGTTAHAGVCSAVLPIGDIGAQIRRLIGGAAP